MINLILASQSPRRQELLKNAGFRFEVLSKNTPEDFSDDLPLVDVPVFLAQKKAQAFIPDLQANDLLITADTVVILDNAIIGKPQDLANAKQMLQQLSGKCHTVVTGVCLTDLAGFTTFSETTLVYFKPLSEAEIDYYLQISPPLDKAGSYGIQDWLGLVGIERIEGDFYNVMGLPLSRLYQYLKDRNIYPLNFS
ncbi:MAG: Maf family protein [Microscillaceae bacterium]|jgi:septum formation protein|nr:Maf family protein [Microscillaceae bacterium]